MLHSALLSTVLAAVFAGLVVVAVTVSIERWGGFVGGFLGTLPTTIVPAAIGMRPNLPNDLAFENAMSVMPAGMLLNVLFLLVWRAVPPRLPAWPLGKRLLSMILISLGLWVVAASIVTSLIHLVLGADTNLSWLGNLVTAILVGVGLVTSWHPAPAPKGRSRPSVRVLFARGALASLMIGIALLLARVAGPLVAGMASVFPVIFLTSMVSLWVAHGEGVPSGAIGPMTLGASSVALYAMLIAKLLPLLGPFQGSVVAWFLAVACTTVPASAWLNHRRKVAAALDA